MKTIHKVMLALTAAGALSLWAEDVPDMFVESVQSKTRTQFVDTGIVPKSGTKVDLDFALIETGSNNYFPVMAGVKNASGQEVRVMGYTYGIRAYLNGRYSGDTSYKGNLVPYHTETTIISKGSTYVEDGVQLEDPPDETWHSYFGTLNVPDCTGLPLYLFAQNNNGTADCHAKMMLYGAKIWQQEGEDWVLKREYKPCVKDGRAGLYDTVSKTIFYSGSGDDLTSNVHTVFPETKDGVTPGQQIINAVSGALKGDVIYFKRGTYTFGDDEAMGTIGVDKLRLTVNVENLAFVGEETTSRKTWTEGAEPVIINVNGGYFAQIKKNGVTFTGLTFTGADQDASWLSWGAVLTHYYADSVSSNCVFRNNAGWRGGAAGNGGFYYDCLFKDNSSLKDANQSTGGAIHIAKTVKDCDFIGNEGQAAGAIGDVSLIDHCTFKANVGRHNGYNCAAVKISGIKSVIQNCLFEANTNVADKTGGILRFEASNYETAVANGYSLFVSNCTFKANYTKSSNGTAYGLVRSNATGSEVGNSLLKGLLVCEDCVFEDNYAPGGFAGAVHAVTAKRCTFRGNHGDDTYNYIYGDCARMSDLYDCDISDGEITACSLTRCTLHDITSRAVFMQSACYVTNCLIRNCRVPWAVAYYGGASEFVNCTFVHNAITESNHYNYIYEYSASATNVNCVYYGNTNASGQAFSVGMHTDEDKQTIVFRSCALGPGKQAGLQYDASCFDVTNPRFAGEPRYAKYYADVPSFAPTAKSPLRGKGLLLDWTDADTDLAGNGRVRDGKVDVGCYQGWWDVVPGAMLLLR